jgi:hypothetical protein
MPERLFTPQQRDPLDPWEHDNNGGNSNAERTLPALACDAERCSERAGAAGEAVRRSRESGCRVRARCEARVRLGAERM